MLSVGAVDGQESLHSRAACLSLPGAGKGWPFSDTVQGTGSSGAIGRLFDHADWESHSWQSRSASRCDGDAQESGATWPAVVRPLVKAGWPSQPGAL